MMNSGNPVENGYALANRSQKDHADAHGHSQNIQSDYKNHLEHGMKGRGVSTWYL